MSDDRDAKAAGAPSEERRLAEAFDSLHVPDGVRARALERIEAVRAEHARAGQEPSRAEGSDSSVRTRREGWHRVRRASRSRRIVAVAACLAIAAFGVARVAAAVTPSAYVSIDVNPSVEIAVNRFGDVVKARGLNADGEAALAGADILWKPYGQALSSISDELGAAAGADAIEVSIACDDDALYASLESQSEAGLGGGQGGSAAAAVRCSRATAEEHAEASAYGMGVAKYRVYERLSAAGAAVTPEECAAMSMRELRDLAAENGIDIDAGSGGAAAGAGANAAEEGAGSRAGAGNGTGRGAGNGYGRGAGAAQDE